ncbi:winged helix-turn-helix domain-containing protein [Thalassospiraceae bacterium LMO-JJ14]|nr:winged helix-turn-helix domain-containing protein [Thalassospiraceae bacterium LMO-JJ14]
MFNDGWEKHDARAAARIGAVIGVPARANMLAALAGGQALTATELALHAGVTAQTASSHLKKMSDLNLIVAEKQGRHRYYRLADARVFDALEPLAHLLPDQPVVHRKPSKILLELKESRMCYDHLAGVLGVAVADALKARGYVTEDDKDFHATATGVGFFAEIGIDFEGLKEKRRHLARRCLDWSERRPHVGGALGAALADSFMQKGWIERIPDSRKVVLTESGRDALTQRLGIE